MRGHKLDHLATNSTIGVAGKAVFTLASAAIAVVEFMAKRSNLCPPKVHRIIEYRIIYITGLFQKIQGQTKALNFGFIFVFVLVDEQAINNCTHVSKITYT